VTSVLNEGARTPDLAGKGKPAITTREMGDRVVKAVNAAVPAAVRS